MNYRIECTRCGYADTCVEAELPVDPQFTDDDRPIIECPRCGRDILGRSCYCLHQIVDDIEDVCVNGVEYAKSVGDLVDRIEPKLKLLREVIGPKT